VSISSTANLCFDIRNSAYESETREKIVVDPTSFVDHEEGAREPPHHFAVKWEGSKKPSVLTVLSAEELKTALKKKKGKHINKKYMIRTLTPDESDEFVPIAAFETRGIVPYAFHPMGGEFIVKSDGGHVFEGDEIDVSDDWCDYDDENDIALSISEFTSKFEAV
jgi:hypothetical protein